MTTSVGGRWPTDTRLDSGGERPTVADVLPRLDVMLTVSKTKSGLTCKVRRLL